MIDERTTEPTPAEMTAYAEIDRLTAENVRLRAELERQIDAGIKMAAEAARVAVDVALSDEACDTIICALDAYGHEHDYEYGLPTSIDHLLAMRPVIRKAAGLE
jgi:hypothetical protein